jgi:hypothetical protein
LLLGTAMVYTRRRWLGAKDDRNGSVTMPCAEPLVPTSDVRELVPRRPVGALERVVADRDAHAMRRLLAVLLTEEGRHAEAAKICADDPSAAADRWRQGKVLTILRGVAQLDPHRDRAWSHVAMRLARQGYHSDLDGLVELAKLRRGPSTYHRLAQAYIALGREDEGAFALRCATGPDAVCDDREDATLESPIDPSVAALLRKDLAPASVGGLRLRAAEVTAEAADAQPSSSSISQR